MNNEDVMLTDAEIIQTKMLYPDNFLYLRPVTITDRAIAQAQIDKLKARGVRVEPVHWCEPSGVTVFIPEEKDLK